MQVPATDQVVTRGEEGLWAGSARGSCAALQLEVTTENE